MTTTIRTGLVVTACAIAFCAPLPSQTEDATSAAKQTDNPTNGGKTTVKKLDGTKVFGFVEVTDDYTIRVTSDSGISRLPIAQLDHADFQKYGFQKDRSKDGRFWYERKGALETSEQNPKTQEDQKSGEKSPVEIRLAEVSAFQPFIAAYEKTLSSKKDEKPTAKSMDGPKTSDTPFQPMFSEPGLGGPLPEPFSALGTSAVQPAVQPIQGGGQIIQSATGAAGVPSPP